MLKAITEKKNNMKKLLSNLSKFPKFELSVYGILHTMRKELWWNPCWRNPESVAPSDHSVVNEVAPRDVVKISVA